jgi:hypothetical protein
MERPTNQPSKRSLSALSVNRMIKVPSQRARLERAKYTGVRLIGTGVALTYWQVFITQGS